jgi:uncharacterized protein (DUF427 family)
MRAIWNDQVIAESTETVVVEGNHYFPTESVNMEFMKAASNTTVCAWKGTAHYYDVVVNGQSNAGAAWYYPEPKEKAAHILDHIAFWRGVTVSE